MADRVSSVTTLQIEPVRFSSREPLAPAFESREVSAIVETRMAEPDVDIAPATPLAQLLRETPCRRALCSGPQQSMVTQNVLRALSETKAQVLSLDVFDTLLLRNNTPEAARYLELSEFGLGALRRRLGAATTNGLTAFDLMLARVQALNLSYRLRPAVDGCVEGCLKEVVAVMRRLLRLPFAAELVLIEAELDYEAENLALNSALVEAALRHKSMGGDLILVSDMYLSADHIVSIIERMDRTRLGPMIDRVFSSADTVVNKRHGGVFALIAQRMNRAPETFLHIGDAAVGDARRPKAFGWRVLEFPIARAELVARERGLERFIAEMDEAGLDVRAWAKL
jgi:hypothetical protein